MRLRLLFLVVAATLMVENVTADGLNLAPILEIVIRIVLNNIKRLGAITLTEDVTLKIPEEIKNISTGTLNLKNAQIFGLDTLNIVQISASNVDTSDENTEINLNVQLTFDRIGFSSNYDADIGLIDEIPIYGNGDFSLAVSLPALDLSLNININEDFSQISVDNLTLNLEVHDSPSHITGFWKNDGASDIVTTIMNILERFVCMWLTYEKDCLSCVLSPIIQNAVNSILPNDGDNKLEINCSCLQDLFGKEDFVSTLLEKLMRSYNEGNVVNLLSNIDDRKFREAIVNIQKDILEILNNEGYNIEV